jgi:hypothetical protein
MNINFFEFIRTHLEMINSECERVAAVLLNLPAGDSRQPELQKVHESLSNIVGVIEGRLGQSVVGTELKPCKLNLFADTLPDVRSSGIRIRYLLAGIRASRRNNNWQTYLR